LVLYSIRRLQLEAKLHSLKHRVEL